MIVKDGLCRTGVRNEGVGGKWCPAVIDYSEANTHPCSSLQQALRDLPMNRSPTDDDFNLVYFSQIPTF